MSIWTRSTQRPAVGVEAASMHSHLYSSDNNGYLNLFMINEKNSVQKGQQHLYLVIYLILSLLVCLAGLLKFLSVLIGSIKASKTLFEDFSDTVFHAPSRWFDVVPAGRILNRFTTDFESIDSSMADGMGFFLTMCLQLLSILVASVFISPYIILVAALLFSISSYLAKLYLPAARDVKRLESITRSPLLEQIQSTTAGVSTIRAYGKTDVYIERLA